MWYIDYQSNRNSDNFLKKTRPQSDIRQRRRVICNLNRLVYSFEIAMILAHTVLIHTFSLVNVHQNIATLAEIN